jgi:selenocysteine-specific elongation factor
MQRVIIGTAGHIDHGKTSLLKALTGIDCDRWAEEKARGITIDLGFAHLEEDDLQLGFIDVPGHERFLRNALAGLGGIKVMLLVVAADEGVKPQTREHLDICSLLEIPQGVVVMTKRDLVDDDLLELAQLETEELLETTPFSGSPVFTVSSTTGEGIPELRTALLELAKKVATEPEAERPLRLPIDRAFQLRGLGAIVTGTLISGELKPGDRLHMLPRDSAARVRSVEVHSQPRERAVMGERAAVQLTGVDLADLERGEQLVAPNMFSATKSLCARLTLLGDAHEPLTKFVPIRFHLYSSEVIGKLRPLGNAPIEPGASGLVEIRLAQPVVALRGDRFVVRRPSPATTLGGGEILDPLWRRHRGKTLSLALKALPNLASCYEFWVLESGERGAVAAELVSRLGRPVAALTHELDRLVSDGRLLAVNSGRGRRWIAPSVCQRVLDRAGRHLEEFFSSDRLAQSMPKAQLLGKILPRRASDLSDVYLRWLEAAKVLVVQGDQVSLPGREVKLSGEESQLSRAFLAKVEAEGLTPPSPNELGAQLGAKRQILEGVLGFLVTQGKLVRLPSGLVLSAAAMEKLRQDLSATGWEEFSVADFKDRFGLSRKWAIPLLEYLDSCSFTRRVGNLRQIIRQQPVPGQE